MSESATPGTEGGTPGSGAAGPAERTVVGTSWVRALAAVVLLAAACPAALFGGSMLGCVGEGFNASCAMDAIFVSPILLFVAGAIAGLLLRGWSGVALMVFGVIVGMFVLLGVSFGIGRPVPVDPISGVIATLWFLAPVSAGYFVGRLLWHLWHHFDPVERPSP